MECCPETSSRWNYCSGILVLQCRAVVRSASFCTEYYTFEGKTHFKPCMIQARRASEAAGKAARFDRAQSRSRGRRCW